jgi:hypothetical protein
LNAQQSTVISDKQISSLPINRRNYLDFAMLTPGVSSAEKINDATDHRVAQTRNQDCRSAATAGAATRSWLTAPPADTNAALQVRPKPCRIQVNRNSYNAEYGGAFGSVVHRLKTGSTIGTAACSAISAIIDSARAMPSTSTRMASLHSIASNMAPDRPGRFRRQNVLVYCF